MAGTVEPGGLGRAFIPPQPPPPLPPLFCEDDIQALLIRRAAVEFNSDEFNFH